VALPEVYGAKGEKYMTKMQLTKEEKQMRARKASQLVDEMLDHPEQFTSKGVIFLWSDAELSSIFTRERMHLLSAVKEKTYHSITELANELGRDISTIRKDLHTLETYGLVTLKKENGTVKIYSDVEAIHIKIEKPRKLEQLLADNIA
jgi:predicted transcriptional regulator